MSKKNLLQWVLMPFSFLYGGITRFRNHLYNIEHYRSFKFETNVISVGNLSVGGTGKTPMTEYLVRLLKADNQVAILSRGYGRKTRGFLAGHKDEHTAKELGDEPFQYLLKYDPEVGVYVGEERAWAIPEILMDRPETDVILLDDAYQHRAVTPSFSILLTRYDKPFFKDHLLPAGRLRESRRGIDRADVLVVTKCPPEPDQSHFLEQIAPYNTNQIPIFFASMRYADLVTFADGSRKTLAELVGSKIILVTGIADATDLQEYLSSRLAVAEHFRFGDHHRYTVAEIRKITEKYPEPDTVFITTEKDYVKIRDLTEDLADLRWFYLPVELYFRDNKETFDKLVKQSVTDYKRS